MRSEYEYEMENTNEYDGATLAFIIFAIIGIVAFVVTICTMFPMIMSVNVILTKICIWSATIMLVSFAVAVLIYSVAAKNPSTVVLVLILLILFGSLAIWIFPLISIKAPETSATVETETIEVTEQSAQESASESLDDLEEQIAELEAKKGALEEEQVLRDRIAELQAEIESMEAKEINN